MSDIYGRKRCTGCNREFKDEFDDAAEDYLYSIGPRDCIPFDGNVEELARAYRYFSERHTLTMSNRHTIIERLRKMVDAFADGYIDPMVRDGSAQTNADLKQMLNLFLDEAEKASAAAPADDTVQKRLPDVMQE